MVEDIKLQISLFQHYRIPTAPLHNVRRIMLTVKWKSWNFVMLKKWYLQLYIFNR